MKHGGLWNGKEINDPKKSYKALLEGGSSGFAALLGGIRNHYGTFYSHGADGRYWSGTEGDARYAWGYYFSGSPDTARRGGYGKAWGGSCRCLQD